MITDKKSILIADDDRDDVEILEEALMDLEPSMQVLKAGGGRETIDILHRQADVQIPQLIVLDYNMPDMTGAEVLATIHNDKRYEEIKKVVWSTSDSTLYEQICKKNGADQYFKKPDNIDDIWLLAKKLLLLI